MVKRLEGSNKKRTLEWGDYPGSSWWARYSHKGSYKWEAGRSALAEGDIRTESRGWNDVREGIISPKMKGNL